MKFKFVNVLKKKKPKKVKKAEFDMDKQLKEVYRTEFDRVYWEERKKFLKEKAAEDAKAAANKETGLKALINQFLGKGL